MSNLTSRFFGRVNGHALGHISNSDAEGLIQFIDNCVESTGQTEGFFIRGFDLPEVGAFGLTNSCFKVPADFYANRPFPGGIRAGKTPICMMEPEPAKSVIVIGVVGSHMITAYGNFDDQVAPMEPWDPQCKNIPGMQEAADSFWSTHSISYRDLKQCGMITRHEPSKAQFKAAAENGVFLSFLGDRDAESETAESFAEVVEGFDLVNAFHIKFGFLAKSLDKGILVFYNGTRDEGFALKATEVLD